MFGACRNATFGNVTEVSDLSIFVDLLSLQNNPSIHPAKQAIHSSSKTSHPFIQQNKPSIHPAKQSIHSSSKTIHPFIQQNNPSIHPAKRFVTVSPPPWKHFATLDKKRVTIPCSLCSSCVRVCTLISTRITDNRLHVSQNSKHYTSPPLRILQCHLHALSTVAFAWFAHRIIHVVRIFVIPPFYITACACTHFVYTIAPTCNAGGAFDSSTAQGPAHSGGQLAGGLHLVKPIACYGWVAFRNDDCNT